MARKNSQKRTRRSKGRSSGGTTRANKLTGDIPPAIKADITTLSVQPPRATSRLMFHQHAPPVLVTASSTADVAGALTFTLNGIDGSGTLQTLFDLYKIHAIRVSIWPNNTAIGVPDPTVNRLVEFYNVIDYNDSSTPSGAAQIREYDNCVITFPSESAVRTFKPRMSATVRSSSGTDYMSVEPQWLNTSSDDVLHYGFKYFVPQCIAAQVLLQTWRIDIEYWVEFQKVTG